MSVRLTPYQCNMVRAGLEADLSLDYFRRPKMISNYPNGIHITDRQKLYYLHQLADKGVIECKYKSRGWYCWAIFRRVYKNSNDPVEAKGLSVEDIPF